MFTSKERSLLELSCFKTIMYASDVCEIQSQNDDHWIIIKVQNHIPKRKVQNVKHFNYTYQLYHRHGDADGFHEQTQFADLLDLVLEIINHDDYKLKRKGKTYFDKVVSMYA